MAPAIWSIATVIGLMALYILWHNAAIDDKMFSVVDMQSKGPAFGKGIPLVHHWAMRYMDAILPFLLGYLVYRCSQSWLSWDWYWLVLIMAAGFAASYFLHLTYVEAGKKFPELTTYGGRLVAAGVEHLLYMGYALGIIGMFYLLSIKPAPFDVWMTTIYLVVHVVVGVHVPLKLAPPPTFPYHGIWDGGTLAPIFGTIVLTVGLSLWALR